MKKLSCATLVTIAALSQTAMAEERTFGAVEYANSCAQCHGMDGTGGGPMANYLTGALPDLTQLQKGNGGVFPFADVYALIDGSGAMGPHGTREMPAWGTRYSLEAEDQLSMDYGVSRDTYVRARILALIEHLASIQAQ